MRDGGGCELHLERREVVLEQGRQGPILAEGEEILLVEHDDVAFAIVFDDAVGGHDLPALVGGSNVV